MSTITDPVVPIPRFEELSPAFQARARRGRERLGVNVNSLHAFAHSEELGGATRDYFESVTKLTVLPNELRLLIRLAVATANQCRYCTAHQRHQLAGLGVSEEKMAAIWKPDTTELSPRERAAVRFAQAITIRRNLNGDAQQTQRRVAGAARIRVRGARGVIAAKRGRRRRNGRRRARRGNRRSPRASPLRAGCRWRRQPC